MTGITTTRSPQTKQNKKGGYQFNHAPPSYELFDINGHEPFFGPFGY